AKHSAPGSRETGHSGASPFRAAPNHSRNRRTSEFASRRIDMTQNPIRFDDGAAYEQMMGVWSGKAGAVFLDWLKPRGGLKWIDVGCGNGAFTELIVARTQPASVEGIDPSEGQLAYARKRAGLGTASFQTGDAMALP